MAGSTLQLLDGLRQQLGEELDLRNEARALAHFRRLGAEIDLPAVVVPEPYPELSGPNVLTMEYLDGVPDRRPGRGGRRSGYDPAPLVEQVVRAFFVTTVRWGAFHGDVHAGNMLLLEDGRLGIIDWGIVGRLDHETHRFFLRLLDGVLGDEAAWADVTAHLTRTYGRAIQEGLGLDDDQLGRLHPQPDRADPHPALRRGEPGRPHVRPPGPGGPGARGSRPTSATAAGGAGPAAGPAADAPHGRRGRRPHVGVRPGTFLLGKQLMYFERYGKMFLADVPILDDREFFVTLLAGAPR